LVIPVGSSAIVRATENVTLVGNLDSSAAIGNTLDRTIRVYDSLGTIRDVQITFTKRAQVTYSAITYNAWDWEATYTNQDPVPVTTVVGSGTLLFDTGGPMAFEGTMAGPVFTPRPAGTPEVSISNLALGTLASYPTDPFEFDVAFGGVTELAADSDVTMSNQDGYPRGVLESFNIGRDGVINGVFTNGLTQIVGQVALANFANVGGVARFGNNLFRDTPASGTPQIGLPNSGGRGQVSGGVLEGSNVDLGTEFTNMIVTQRGFQANARTITTADTLLQEAVNLVR
jgi:flagellar hook protein FlgE